MEFVKSSKTEVMSDPVLQDPHIMIHGQNDKKKMDEFSQSTINSVANDDLTEEPPSSVSSSLPMYLLTTEGSDGCTQRYIVSDPFKDSEIGDSSNLFKDSEITAGTSSNFTSSLGYPLSYYTSTTPPSDNSQILSIINNENEDNGTSNAVTQVTSSDLSEEMIRSFVVGGGNPQHTQTDAAGSSEVIDPTQVVTAIITDDETNVATPTEKQVIIVTEGAEGEDMVVEDDDYFQDAGMAGYENGEFMVTLLPNKEDMNVYDASYTGGVTTNEPPLDLQFEVAAEITNLEGQLLRREIVTQTTTWRKPRATRKQKQSSYKGEGSLVNNSTNNKQFKCDRCSLKFQQKDMLDIHVKCHTVLDKVYKCFHCGETHKHWVKMYHHLFSHGIEKPHKCPVCSFSCISKSDLIAHEFVHSKTKNWTCPKCKRSFKHRRNMVAHERTCPGVDESGKMNPTKNEEKFVCSVCSKQLSNKRNLEKHFEIHLDVKPFVCDLCGHSTRLKESLIMHKRLHTGEKPFKCDICNYATPDKSSLRRHKRRHSNEKPYKCSYCGYKCIQKHCLENHIRRKHTGEQFVCGLCHFSTHDRYGLNQHFKQHQNGGVTSEITQSSAIVNISTDCVVNSAPKEQESTKTDTNMNLNMENVVLQIQPTQENNKSETWATASSAMSGSDVLTSNKNLESQEINVEAIAVNAEQHMIQLTGPEGTLLQQIQQPGDLVFIRENGEILIKKPDGTILLIQQQMDEKDNMEEVSQTPETTA
uniref:zinc finger protein isoform X1 n=1 Tax=Ciona intestinalis TaxID=7719 RepID=UPI0000522758|nr:zinc finger protein isoform X1 [Ciona intestinalis]|eukprot:XP_009857958.1 zinc finger protein isoform X1 [Ciona intestinalis]